jgi:hypothetical protein
MWARCDSVDVRCYLLSELMRAAERMTNGGLEVATRNFLDVD